MTLSQCVIREEFNKYHCLDYYYNPIAHKDQYNLRRQNNKDVHPSAATLQPLTGYVSNIAYATLQCSAR